MLQVKSKESFDIILANLSAKNDFSIYSRGTRRTVFLQDKPIVLYHKSSTKEITENREKSKRIMIEVRISVTNYIKKHLETGISLIPKNYSPVYSNVNIWDELPVGSQFYLIDARHCYWRIAYILGYISKRVYMKYVDDNELKALKNISLSILTSNIKKEYYSEGNKINEIFCDITHYQQIYKNIRHYAYNNSGQIQEAIKDYCIAYRVDGVFVLKQGLNKAKKIFEKNNLLYKVTKCVKIDDKNYSNEDGELKKML